MSRSSPADVTRWLTELRFSKRLRFSAEEWELTLSVYSQELCRFRSDAVQEACREWRTRKGWPSLDELVTTINENRELLEPKSLPGPEEERSRFQDRANQALAWTPNWVFICMDKLFSTARHNRPAFVQKLGQWAMRFDKIEPHHRFEITSWVVGELKAYAAWARDNRPQWFDDELFIEAVNLLEPMQATAKSVGSSIPAHLPLETRNDMLADLIRSYPERFGGKADSLLSIHKGMVDRRAQNLAAE